MSGRLTIRGRLARMLSRELGITITADDLHDAKGAYRTGLTDTFRWETTGQHDIASFSTMTDCVRNGFVVTRGRHKTCTGSRIEVVALASRNPPERDR